MHFKHLPAISIALFCARAALAAFTPIPLGDGANASFRDDFADDRKGGFIDLGSNDLSALPSGIQYIGGIEFDIGASATSAEKACIVLGGKRRDFLAQSAEVKLAAPVKAECLYLLHGSAFTSPDGKPVAGTLRIAYSDGTSEKRNVRVGRDVGDWISSLRGHDNAVRAWTVYNGNTQVSLFVSRFRLPKDKALSSIVFTADEGTWFVAGATAGHMANVRRVAEDLRIARSYEFPDLYVNPLPTFAAGAKPRNVVFVLGDGMGLGSLVLASEHLRHRPGALVLDQLPYAGLATTHSANSAVTDSAASGTAFACGRKTNNSMLGMLPDGTRVTSVAARAHDAGFAVGLLTDDSFTGATPSAYYAHVPTRSAGEDICAHAAKCGYEILLGYGCRELFLPSGTDGGKRKDGRNLLSEMAGRGYAFCDTLKSFLDAGRDSRVLALLKKDELSREASFRDMMDNALVRLSQGGRRFFMMMETADPDHGSHANRPAETVCGVAKADWAVRTAVDWSLAHGGDTLVVVMADHETGGVSAVVSAATGNVAVHFDATSHTGAPVPVHAFGPGAELFEGVYDNTDVARRLAKLLDLSLD